MGKARQVSIKRELFSRPTRGLHKSISSPNQKSQMQDSFNSTSIDSDSHLNDLGIETSSPIGCESSMRPHKQDWCQFGAFSWWILRFGMLGDPWVLQPWQAPMIWSSHSCVRSGDPQFDATPRYWEANDHTEQMTLLSIHGFSFHEFAREMPCCFHLKIFLAGF